MILAQIPAHIPHTAEDPCPQNVDPSAQTQQQLPGVQCSAPKPFAALFPEPCPSPLHERSANARLPDGDAYLPAARGLCSRSREPSPPPRERGSHLPAPTATVRTAAAAASGTCKWSCSPGTRDSTPELGVEDDPECLAARSESVGPKLFPIFRPKSERKVRPSLSPRKHPDHCLRKPPRFRVSSASLQLAKMAY